MHGRNTFNNYYLIVQIRETKDYTAILNSDRVPLKQRVAGETLHAG